MLDRLQSWLPTRADITANAVGNVVVWAGGGALAVVGAWALSWLAAPTSDRDWVNYFLLSLVVFGFLWVAIAIGWRRFYPLPTSPTILVNRDVAVEAPSAWLPSNQPNDDVRLHSDDPERDAPDKEAYNDILAFAIDRVLPACNAMIDLQEALIGHMARGAKIAELALEGFRSESLTTGEFWKHYDGLSGGLSASPGPILKFEGIIEHIHGLESGSYERFSQQMFELFCDLERDKYTAMSKRLSTWRHEHRALVDAYDAIKRDTRFGKLLRPLRDSRWGRLKLGEPTE